MTLTMFTVGAQACSDLNVLADAWCEESNRLRRVKRIALIGSDDVLEISAKVMYQNRVIAMLRNTVEDTNVVHSTDMISISSKDLCYPGEELGLVLNGTIATTALAVVMEIEEVPFPRRRGRGRVRRRFGKRRY